MNDPNIQRRLLAEPNLTLKKALEIAQALETAEHGSADLQPAPAAVPVSVPVNAVGRQRRGVNEDPVKDPIKCFRCGGKHLATACKFIDAGCFNCGKTYRVCRSKGKPSKSTGKCGRPQKPQKAHTVTTEGNCIVEHVTLNLSSRDASTIAPFEVSVQVDDKYLKMEVDTGASVSLISERTWRNLWKNGTPKLNPAKVILRSYSGESIKVLGEMEVTVQYQDQKKKLNLLVVTGGGTSLLGRDWLRHLKLNWCDELNHLRIAARLKLDDVLKKHADVFKEELGKVTGMEVKIHMDPDAQPQFFRPRPVPLALRPKVERELERLVQDKVIEPVQFSEWAAPIVPVVKSNGSLWICGDYKATVNKYAKTEEYPLPRIEDLFAALSGGQEFTKLDLANAYLQLPLEDKSRQYVTINTHKGLFKYYRLPFGVASAPAIFQRTIESLLQGMKHVVAYIDDILITAEKE